MLSHSFPSTLALTSSLYSFVGLFGTYYALQYLSLSDATVLSFLTPMATAITGALLLKEDLTINQVLASGMCLQTGRPSSELLTAMPIVFSFVGVVLIARPVFLFGSDTHDVSTGDDSAARVVTATQRLGAVGCVVHFVTPLEANLCFACRVALLGVVGLTSACK